MDNWLIELAMMGDQEAFAKLVEKHHRFVLGIAYQFLKDQQEAEDIAQEVFLKFYKFLPKYKNVGKFRKFIYRLAINECISRFRRKSLRKVNHLEEEVACPEKIPEEILESKELAEILSVAASELPPRQKQAFLLKIHGEYSYEEISETLGCPETSIGSLIFRARKSLAEKLQKLLKE